MAIVRSWWFQASAALAATELTPPECASAGRLPSAPCVLTYETATCIPTFVFCVVSKVSQPPATTPEPCWPASDAFGAAAWPVPYRFACGFCLPCSVTEVAPGFVANCAALVPPQVPDA